MKTKKIIFIFLLMIFFNNSFSQTIQILQSGTKTSIRGLSVVTGKSGDVDQANPVQDDHPKLTSNIFFKAVVHSC